MNLFWITTTITVGLIAFVIGLYFWLKQRVSKANIAIFCRQMSILLDAGIPLLRVFKILSERINPPRLRQTLREILVSVENGNTISSAMDNHPRIFDEMIVGIVNVGETGGALEESMRRLAVYLEKSITLRRKVIIACVYPLLTLVVLIAVLCVLVVFVFPNILEPFRARPDVQLPGLTIFVDQTGQLFMNHWLLIAATLAGLAVAVGIFRKTRPGKILEDYIKIKTPFLGNYMGTRVITARVAAMFSTLLHCGIAIIPALKIISQTQPNYFVAESFKKTAKVVEDGGTIVKALEESGLYPQLMLDMISIGDESGALDVVLEKVSQVFNEEVDIALEVFTQLQESVLILLVGTIVLIVALAAYLPYFYLAQAVA